tara:strand:- start:4296 stop:4643 length:348 start_codon:yes stop_codon:yes gene_type:complete
MAKKLEVVQNGNFSNGDPVFQIGSINADGDREIAVFDLMTESEAKAKLKSMGGSSKSTSKAAEPVEEVEETTKVDLNKMTKVELEEFAREFGVELDRREKKETLVKQAYKAQFDG